MGEISSGKLLMYVNKVSWPCGSFAAVTALLMWQWTSKLSIISPQWVASLFSWVRGWAYWLSTNTNLSAQLWS